MVSQSYALYPQMTVRDHMGLALKRAGVPRCGLALRPGMQSISTPRASACATPEAVSARGLPPLRAHGLACRRAAHYAGVQP